MPRSIDPGTIRVGTGFAVTGSADGTSSSDGGLSAHIDDPVAAHPASAISIDGAPALFNAGDVEGALDELSALIPPRPPALGKRLSYVTFTGIPDWGSLKMNDAGVVARGAVASANLDEDIYPYFHVVPEPADDDPPFSPEGNAPATDPTFNITDGAYTGGGDGTSYAGGFTRATDVVETMRLVPTTTTSVVISGALYPADRGVLALLYFPQPGSLAAFTGQAAGSRCITAILLGQGIVSGCDGDPGGIFTLGETGGDYDPYVFPGQATGQYDLEEIHTGTSVTGGTAPAADSAAGMVRLGYTILGSTTNADAPTLGADSRNDNNFFAYRLPYLDDYSSSTGLRYTPEAEHSRYFIKPAVSLNPATNLTQAGDFPDFERTYWTFQVARFRQRFTITPNGDAGNFVLLHFKKEEDLKLWSILGRCLQQTSFTARI